LRWRSYGQDARYSPAVWRLYQDLIHQELRLLRRLPGCPYGEDDWDVDLRHPVADHDDFQT
jgi:hypothetical protein